MDTKRKCLAAIRVRGSINIPQENRDTLKLLRLTRNCHATLVDDRPSFAGMLRKVQHYLAWGEISKETLLLLLEKRGRLVGNKRLTDRYAQELGYKSLGDLAAAAFNLDVEYANLPEIKPIFRLHPPKKGFKGKLKRSYSAGGVTGYRGEAIDGLIKQMI